MMLRVRYPANCSPKQACYQSYMEEQTIDKTLFENGYFKYNDIIDSLRCMDVKLQWFRCDFFIFDHEFHYVYVNNRGETVYYKPVFASSIFEKNELIFRAKSPDLKMQIRSELSKINRKRKKANIELETLSHQKDEETLVDYFIWLCINFHKNANKFLSSRLTPVYDDAYIYDSELYVYFHSCYDTATITVFKLIFKEYITTGGYCIRDIIIECDNEEFLTDFYDRFGDELNELNKALDEIKQNDFLQKLKN